MYKMDSDLTFRNKGSGEGQFEYPWSIACNSTGKVYVTDGNNITIKFKSSQLVGSFLNVW